MNEPLFYTGAKEFNMSPEFTGYLCGIFFASANIPMVQKALKTGDLSSYSFTYLLIQNIANSFYWHYVLSLPFGGIYIMHTVYSLSMLVMLILYVKQYVKASPNTEMVYD